VISYDAPGFYRAILTFLKIRPVEKADFLINPPYSPTGSYVTAVAVGQSQRLCTGYYLSFFGSEVVIIV
jgi:hypothetical protein